MSAAVVDLRLKRASRTMNVAGQELQALAVAASRNASMYRQCSEGLHKSKELLSRINGDLLGMQQRLSVTQDYLARCQSAAQINDLEEMIRQRDNLALELHLRREE